MHVQSAWLMFAEKMQQRLSYVISTCTLQQWEADQFIALLKVSRLVAADRQTKLTTQNKKTQDQGMI